MEQKEDTQLNRPAKQYFEQKLKCDFARVGFTFSAGELDVLAYNRKSKCFHIREGKRSSNIASVGHAIGQLIAYISMIQENGYDFLNRISKGERLELTDFSNFLEKKAIRVCFYIILPQHRKDRLLKPARLMLSNLGDFGKSIGIFFASNKKCELEIQATPLDIKIRRDFDREQFFEVLTEQFFDCSESKGLIVQQTNYPFLIKIKEKDGNPYLHFEVGFKKKLKLETKRRIEIGFHLEFAKAHLQDKRGKKRKSALQRVLLGSRKGFSRSDINFRYQLKWGKHWSRVYTIYETPSSVLDDEVLNDVLYRLKLLASSLKPKFDAINWGRKREKPNEHSP
jgi:hypothetical protein